MAAAKMKAAAKLAPNPAGLKGEARAAWLEAAKSGALLALRSEKAPMHNWDICKALGISIDAAGAGALYASMKGDERFIFAPKPSPDRQPLKAHFALSAKGKAQAAKLAKS